MKRFPNRDTIVSALKESEMLELSGGAGEETLKRKVPLEITAVIPREVATAKGRWEHPIAVGPITDKAITRSIYAVCLISFLSSFLKDMRLIRGFRLNRKDLEPRTLQLKSR